MEKDYYLVRSITNQAIKHLEAKISQPGYRAELANLRHSINRPLSQSIAALEGILRHFPEDFTFYREGFTDEEASVLAAMQLYALSQQGQANQKEKEADQPGKTFDNFGLYLAQIRDPEDSTALDRRFNAMITATTWEELLVHLRHLVALLKGKQVGRLNFGQLAQDLYDFKRGYDDRLRVNWSLAYYRRRPSLQAETENKK